MSTYTLSMRLSLSLIPRSEPRWPFKKKLILSLWGELGTREKPELDSAFLEGGLEPEQSQVGTAGPGTSFWKPPPLTNKLWVVGENIL